MLESIVFDIGRYTGVTVFVPPEEELKPKSKIIQYYSGMSYLQINKLLFYAVPTDRFVTSSYIAKITGLPYTSAKITSMIKRRLTGIEWKKDYNTHKFKRVTYKQLYT